MTPRKDAYSGLHLEPLAPSSPVKLHLLVAGSGRGRTPPAHADSAVTHTLIRYDSYSSAKHPWKPLFLALESP